MAEKKKRHFGNLDVASRLQLKTELPPAGPGAGQEALMRALVGAGPEAVESALLAGDTGFSFEQQAAMRARAWAQRIIKTDDKVRQALSCMLAFRRSYAVAYREVQEALLAYPAADALTEDFLIQAIMHQAAQPFNEHDLMAGLAESVLPWVATTVDKHTEEDVEAQKEAEEESKEELSSSKLPLGLYLDCFDSAEPALPRSKSLVLIGPRKALFFVLYKLIEAAMFGKEDKPNHVRRAHSVVRFCAEPPPGIDDARLVRLGPALWKGSCNSSTELATCMGTHIADCLSAPPDLLVVDDLDHAYTRGYVGRPRGASAGDAHKALRKWCDRASAGLIAGLPVEGEPDLLAPELEQLRIFAWLRAVHVHEAEDKYHINITGSAHVWEVDKGEIDAIRPT